MLRVVTAASHRTPIQDRLEHETDDFLVSLPGPDRLSAVERRAIIARYTAVLEGNFIYWMTGAHLAATTAAARAIILDNLHEEVRDAHPLMLRKFALAAHASPTEADAMAIHRNLTNVRLFIGRLSAPRILVMMAFFEGLLQRFMPYLADLAKRQGSAEFQYTDVHGECDIAHTQGLYRAVDAELARADDAASEDLFEGVKLLRTLLLNVITG
jgi:hypothetical protein